MDSYVDDRYVLACCKICLRFEFLTAESVYSTSVLNCTRTSCSEHESMVFLSWGAALVHLNKKKMDKPYSSARVDAQIEMINLGYRWIDDSPKCHQFFLEHENQIRPQFTSVPLEI